MKIAWLGHRDIRNPRAGGAERSAFEIGRRMAVDGNEVDLYAVREGTLSEQEILGPKISILRPFSSNVAAHAGIARHVRAGDYSIAIDDLAHVVPWASNALARVPTIAYFRHLHRRTLPGQLGPVGAAVGKVVERTYPWVYRRNLFVTESASSRDDLVSLGIHPSKCNVIPPGVDANVFKPRTKRAYPSIVYFGGLRDYKRPEHVVLAFQRVHDVYPEARLVIYGIGPSRDRTEAAAFRAGVDRFVEFRGRVGEGQLAEELGSAWVNVHASLAEGWCLSAMEAAAAGVPTVAYRVPGIRDSVASGVSGLLIDDPRPEELAAGIMSVLREPDVWVQRARSYAQRHSWEVCEAAWCRLINSAVASATG